jgi:copper chaperone NosL
MLLLDYPGPKAQIHYASGETEFFCDTMEMFAMLLQPEQHRKVTAAYTQDMGAAEWRKPVGNWIDARSAVYVKDSKLMGSMGPTLASFATQAGAEAFIKEYGGTAYRYDEVTPGMADLRGGAHHDHNM